MLTASAIAWMVFCVALAVCLAGVLWESREVEREPVDWDRFMRDLESWSDARNGGSRTPHDA